MKDARSTRENFRKTQPPNWQKPLDYAELKDSVTQGLRKKAEESSRIRVSPILINIMVPNPGTQLTPNGL